MSFFGDGNVSVNENRDTLKCSLTLNVYFFLNMLLYIAIHPCTFCKIAPINLVMVVFTTNLEMHCFKRRRHNVRNNYVRWLLFCESQQNCY